MNEEEKIFMALIKFNGDVPTIQRIRESAPSVKAAIEKLSRNNCQLVFTSDSGDCFAYLLKTHLPAGVICAELEGRTESSVASPLRSDDDVLVVEIGSQFTGSGFSRAWTWLQHR
jgi:hypothetical protein